MNSILLGLRQSFKFLCSESSSILGRTYSCFPACSINCNSRVPIIQHFPSVTAFEAKSLVPFTPLVNQVCGFKLKATLRKRCKGCYIVVRDGRSYMLCTLHPRHKQMALTKHKKSTWILTHATQGKERPW